MCKISIIVPVYNSEKFLNKCIESILKQSFKDYELIIIDDGSTDNSKMIYRYYEKIDKRIRIIQKNQNTGVADVRNIGIDNATADYIGFIDSDDWIEQDMFEVLYNNIIKFDADISACRISVDYPTYSTTLPLPNEDYLKIIDINKDDIVRFMKGEYYLYGMVNKLIKKSLYKNLRFIPGTIYNEDDYMAFKLLEKAKRIILDSSVKYHYIQNADSIMHRDKFDLHDLELIKTTLINLNIAREKYPELIEYLEARLFRFRKIVVDKLLASNIDNKNKYLMGQRYLLNKDVINVLLNKELKLHIKASIIMIIVNVKLYNGLKRLKRKI